MGTARDVAAWLADQIHSGMWPADGRLPPERVLALHLGVARGTVASAYDELQAMGLVDRRRGSGTYVHGDLWGVAPDWTKYLEGAAFRPTQALVQRYRDARRQASVVDFTQADLGSALWPSRSLRQCLPGIDVAGALGYADPLGLASLREAVATEMARRAHVSADPESVLMTAGAQQALYLMVHALLKPGDAIAIEKPSFYYSLSLFQSAGIRLLPIPMDREGLDPEGLEALVRRARPAMVWVNPTYHNPTTTTLVMERRLALLDLCHRWNLPLVEDDAFAHLTAAGSSPPPPPLKAIDHGHRVIYVGSLSKIAAPGLRIGWIIAPRPVIDRLADAKGQIDLGMAGLMQALALAFLTSNAWPEHVDMVQRELAVRRDRFVAGLNALRAQGLDAEFEVPAGGLYVWVRWGPPISDRRRLERAVERGVVFAPGRVFGADDGYGRFNYVWEHPGRAAEGLRRLVTAFGAGTGG